MVLKIARHLSLAAALLLLHGCYYLQAASGQLGVMSARQPIDKVIAKPSTPASLKEQLLRAQRIREFASRELGLPDNAAYRSYADIKRKYVVWNVVATPEFSVDPLHWCFPIAGCVAYRGYFKEKAAEDFAAQLKKQGDDVVIGGVPAYSTLGRIADPLLNTVTGYSELDLAALVFHELAHQEAYDPRDSSYNEAFATAVEEEGVTRYAARLGNPQVLETWKKRGHLRIEMTTLLSAARADLVGIYRQRLAPDAMRSAKQQRLAQLATDIRALEQREGMRTGYGAWIEEGLNNAHLASVATYYDQVPHFEQMLKQRCGDYLPCLYVTVRQEIRQRASKPAK